MKNILVSLLVISASATVFAAQTMKCDVQMFVGNEVKVIQTISVEKSSDPHGSVAIFKLTEFGGVSGMVALMSGDTAVINLYSEQLSIGSSSFGVIANGQAAHHQLILPNVPGTGINGLVVDCAYVTN
ncbi:MAG: hypothetical protein H7328_06270 [Bdellovibrio sp.]|nr:hypothetical protein [Bdellovibrio sp.]